MLIDSAMPRTIRSRVDIRLPFAGRMDLAILSGELGLFDLSGEVLAT